MKLFPVILSGGSGTRLWPVSRELYPKQLVPLTGKDSLFQLTLQRCQLLSQVLDFDVNDPIVICNEQHRFLIAQQAQDSAINLGALILEPEAKNTAPALTLAAEYIKKNYGNGLMLVLAADHAIENPEQFANTLGVLASSIKDKASIGILGIQPTHAHTGYGYIHSKKSNDQVRAVEAFKEKPSSDVAESYFTSGDYYWNSGMFVTQIDVWLKSIAQFNPLIADACLKAIDKAQSDLDFLRADAAAFSQSPADSIDYAVIEKVSELSSLGIQLNMISLDCGWTDLGAWSSVADYKSNDDNGNVHIGDVISEDSKNNFVMSQQRLIATVGVNDLVVVETPDAVLVTDKSRAQDVKKIVKRLSEEGRDEHLVHRRVYRPWGNYETVDSGERYQVKRIIVNPGASLSLQMHHHRAEHWIVVHGTAEVTRGEETFLMSENQSTYIPIGTTHRLVNPGKFPLELIEVQSGSYLGEDDIVRFDDVYGREKDKVVG